MDKVSIGDRVHCVLEDGPSAGQERPAVIVKVLDQRHLGPGCITLQVFTDATSDGPGYLAGIAQKSLRNYSKIPFLGTWHWPEEAENAVP